jgi:UDP-GlcNAc:undecaprenyl-phosphate GlcNAc-1-phosphate transferase
MNTIFFAFFVALLASLVLTPFARYVGVRFGALDVPDERKVHVVPTPRLGGAAIFVSALCAVGLLELFDAGVAKMLVVDRQFAFLVAGTLVCFFTGLADDFRPLGAKLKLGCQIAAATVAFAGGTWIGMGYFGGLGWFGWMLSYGLTVFWFLLFVNAVNLIDGLDGLAGGVCFFVTLVMVAVTLMTGNVVVAMLFAALAGSVLGFLRYNFNPASIFLGDGGSYFLGFSIAGLSILGNVKEQTWVALLIPLIAMGVPLFDTLLSTVRRFLRGRGIFSPDNRHLHHRLVALGLTTRRAVLLVYGMTIVLCAAALVVVQWQDGRVGFVLAALGAGAVILTRSLGYFDVLGFAQLRNWLDDVAHASGVSKHRRDLLDMQIEIRKSRSLDELWSNVVHLLERLEFSHGRLFLVGGGAVGSIDACTNGGCKQGRRRERDASVTADACDEPRPDYSWDSSRQQATAGTCSYRSDGWFFRLELPLVAEKNGKVLGVLVLSKAHDLGEMGPRVLLSVEQLRRVLSDVLDCNDFQEATATDSVVEQVRA